jgi:hypothetical protein
MLDPDYGTYTNLRFCHTWGYRNICTGLHEVQNGDRNHSAFHSLHISSNIVYTPWLWQLSQVQSDTIYHLQCQQHHVAKHSWSSILPLSVRWARDVTLTQLVFCLLFPDVSSVSYMLLSQFVSLDFCLTAMCIQDDQIGNPHNVSYILTQWNTQGHGQKKRYRILLWQ